MELVTMRLDDDDRVCLGLLLASLDFVRDRQCGPGEYRVELSDAVASDRDRERLLDLQDVLLSGHLPAYRPPKHGRRR